MTRPDTTVPSLRRALLGWTFAILAALPTAQAAERQLCAAAIALAETGQRLPPSLLISIALVESGRPDPSTGRVTPWPWTINIAGKGYFFDSKEDAIAATRRAQAEGTQSIDVGCMQVNLLHHPAAFGSLDQAFDPAANAAYAADFLSRLFVQLRTWPAATAAYHSTTPELAEPYRDRVMALWPLAKRYGGDVRFATTPRAPAADPNQTQAFRTLLAERSVDHAAWVRMGLVAGPTRLPASAPRSLSRLAIR